MKYYKIRNRRTGLYSTGGKFPDWTKKGKSWASLGHIAAHLSQHVGENYQNWIYANCEIVTFALIEEAAEEITPHITQATARVSRRAAEYAERARIFREEVELDRLRELIEKYPEVTKQAPKEGSVFCEAVIDVGKANWNPAVSSGKQ